MEKATPPRISSLRSQFSERTKNQKRFPPSPYLSAYAVVVFLLDFSRRSVPNSAGIPLARGSSKKTQSRFIFGGDRFAQGNLSHQKTGRYSGSPRGTRNLAEADSWALECDVAWHRRDHRRRYLCHRRHRRCRRLYAAGRWSIVDGVIRDYCHRVRVYRALLRRDGCNGADIRLSLHLFIRHPGRTGRLDHRLGLDPRIRHWQCRGGHQLGKLLSYVREDPRHRYSTMALDRLSHGAQDTRTDRECSAYFRYSDCV